MNAQNWLTRATGEFPDSVARRVSAETLAHLQDAGLPPEADVSSVLGSPDHTARALRRLYLTNKEWHAFQNGRSVRRGLMTSAWLLCTGIFVLQTWSEPSLPRILALAVYLLTLAWTVHFHPVRRQNFGIWLLLLMSLLLDGLPDLWARTELGAQYLLVIALAFLALVGARYWRLDQRMRHTLALEGEPV